MRTKHLYLNQYVSYVRCKLQLSSNQYMQIVDYLIHAWVCGNANGITWHSKNNGLREKCKWHFDCAYDGHLQHWKLILLGFFCCVTRAWAFDIVTLSAFVQVIFCNCICSGYKWCETTAGVDSTAKPALAVLSLSTFCFIHCSKQVYASGE